MSLRFALLLVAPLVLLMACRDPKITSYRVPKEKPEALPPILTGQLPSGDASGTGASGDMAASAVPTATGESLSWNAPEHWKTKPASAMRKGSYAVPGENGAEADFSITAFPGDVGGELANVNRWRGQLELSPLKETDLPEATTRLEQNGLNFVVVEFANYRLAKPQRIIGALVPFDGATWFFKLMGPEMLVAREKPTFFAFLQTVKPAAPARATR
jgi:hypothetical protein